jgi:hypothetical protein
VLATISMKNRKVYLQVQYLSAFKKIYFRNLLASLCS